MWHEREKTSTCPVASPVTLDERCSLHMYIFTSTYIQHMRQALARYQKHSHETLFQIMERVRATVGDQYGSLLHTGSFVPAGRTLRTACPDLGIQPNCAVIPWRDLSTQHALLYESTGVGVNFDSAPEGTVLRAMKAIANLPKADHTKRTPGLMGTLHYTHPDAKAFVDAKRNTTMFDTFNISLRVDKDFFTSPLFMRTAQAIHECGDPGLLFCERGREKATAPCGELWLEPYEVCNLGNIVLSHVVGRHGVDQIKLHALTKEALHFLDDVIDRFNFPNKTVEKATLDRRRVGLGVMGFADACDRARVRYGSPESILLAHTIGHIMRKASDECTLEMASSRGAAPLANGRRNITCLAFAPTGGTALIKQASYSIEPHFEHVFETSFDNQLRIVDAFQTHVDGAISKTVNVPSDASPEYIAHVLKFAYYSTCMKGITVYRDGSKTHQPISCDC